MTATLVSGGELGTAYSEWVRRYEFAQEQENRATDIGRGSDSMTFKSIEWYALGRTISSPNKEVN